MTDSPAPAQVPRSRLPTRPLLLLDCYVDPDGAGRFFDPWLERAPRERVHLVAGDRPDRPEAYAGVVVTGSSASVYEREPWSEAAIAWLRRAMEARIPVLGVCYGHQLLGEALGGEGTVRRAAAPEVGFLEVQLRRGDPLFDALPSRFTTFMTHNDEVVARPAFEGWGESAACGLQALRVPGAPVWGVQFHVEYPPEEQLRLLRMREARHPDLGFDAAAMFAARSETGPQARALFGRFLEICGWR